MTYREKYITFDEYQSKYLDMGKLYEGFVMGYGYAYTKAKVFQPPHMNGYSPTAGHVYGYSSHNLLGREQLVDTSIEAIKLSLQGLFEINMPFANKEAWITVKQGMTIGGIAEWFDVTVADLVTWNGLKDSNKIYIGQKIKIIDKRSGIPKTDYTSKTNDALALKESSFNGRVVSTTITNRATKDMDMIFLNPYSFVDATIGKTKLINTNITTNKTFGKPSQTSTSLGLNLGLLRAGVSKNSMSNTISILGYVEAETSINYDSFWDLSINFELRQNMNKDHASTGIGLGVKPIKVLALVVIVGGIVITAPVNLVRPAFAPASITPVMPLSEKM